MPRDLRVLEICIVRTFKQPQKLIPLLKYLFKIGMFVV
jgi:hypothetical protein